MVEPRAIAGRMRFLVSLFCMSMLLSGCGLKGDLYLEEPADEEKQPVDADSAADVPAAASDPEQATPLDSAAQQPAGDAGEAPAQAESTATGESRLPALLTEQDSLQEAQQQNEADIGNLALENVNPNDDQEESSDESEAIESPAEP